MRARLAMFRGSGDNVMRRVPGFLIAAGVAAILAAAIGLGAGQAPATPQQPTFRTAANFVQVDVYPVAGGRAVGDLTKDDFEVLEDGVPQVIETFEHVSVGAGSLPSERVEPRSLREANEQAADARNRLFVLFLDTYHVTDPTSWHNGQIRMAGSTVGRRPPEKKPLGPRAIDKAIVSFMDRAIGPDDLVAAMSPEMDASRLVFTRRPKAFEEWVATVWGRRFSWDDLDPQEEQWGLCYPPDDVGDPFGCFRGIFEEMVLRRREQLTLKSLEDLVARLRDLREGRKAVLLVSEGWAMYRPDLRLTRAVPLFSKEQCPPEPPVLPGIYVGPGGKLQSGTDPRLSANVDHHECDTSRRQLAMLDNEQTYRRLLDEANRSNVSFYPIDPRGLAVFDTPFDVVSPGPLGTPAQPSSAAGDMGRLGARLDTLRNLASATDGTMTETNDLTGGLKKIAQDLSEYYLLGYRSTNGKLDGKFRKITVRAKRPGVVVRARRGYLAPTEAEVKAANLAEEPPDPEVQMRSGAWALLRNADLDRTVRLTAGYEWRRADAARPPRKTPWAFAELGSAAARLPEWRDGGELTLTITTPDGRTMATERASLLPSARAVAWHLAQTPLEGGEYLVRVRLAGKSTTLADASDQVRLVVPDDSPSPPTTLGQPQVFRRGPSTGLAFQPTSDVKFRRVERLRLEIPIVAASETVSARLLDRGGQELSIPVAAGQRDNAGVHCATAEAVLASLAPGEYMIEVTATTGSQKAKALLAFRIIP